MTGDARPSVFVSWAHKHRSMTDAEAKLWATQVRALAEDLRMLWGLDVRLDRLQRNRPEFTRWGPNMINDCDKVVIVASKAYKERWEGRNLTGEGAGAAREIDTIKSCFNRDQHGFHKKFFVVLLPGIEDTEIPNEIFGRLERFSVDPTRPDGLKELAAALWDHHRYPDAPIGPPPTFPREPYATDILRGIAGAESRAQDDGVTVPTPVTELRDVPAAPAPDDPPETSRANRVLRLCVRYARELDQDFDTANGRTSFSAGLYVVRDVQQEILGRLADPAESDRPVAVVGEAGYGKTSLLWGLYRDLTDHPRLRPLLVNAAWLHAAQPGHPPILSGEDLVHAVKALYRSGTTPVVLLDTMDLLLHEEARSVQAIDLLDEVAGAGALVVVTCREQEATALDRHFAIVRLGTYTESELPGAIEQHVLAFCPDAPPQSIEDKRALMLRLAAGGLGMSEVVHHPLFLRLLFEAYEGSFPNEELDTRGVLAAYFDQKICDDVRGQANSDVACDDVHVECFCLAIALFSAGAVALPRKELLCRAQKVATAWVGARADALSHALDLLIERSVLLADSPDGIRFRHQLLFEYVAARALIERGGAAELHRLLDIVKARPLDLFTGAVFEQALIYAWGTSRTQQQGLAAVLTTLAESPSVNLQSMALVVTAHHPDAEANVTRLLQRAETETVRRFVELTPRVSGPNVGRTLLLLRRVWDRSDPLCRRAVLNVLERFAPRDGRAVRDFIVDKECIEYVVEAKGDLLLSQRALPRSLGLLAATDPAWSTDGLFTLFEVGTVTRRRALAVAILNIVADQWAYLGSPSTLRRFTRAIDRAQERNGGQETEMVRLAGGRLFAAYWTEHYRLATPQPRAEQWLATVTETRRKLAANPQAPLQVQLRLMGVALVLASLPDGHILIDPTLRRLFPPAGKEYGLPMLELSASFLVPLLRSASAAGRRTRALVRDALARLPADPTRTDDPRSLRVSAARKAVTDARLPVGELARLLDDLPSLSRPEQWIDPCGAIALVVPAALGGHPVARAALNEIAADPALVAVRNRSSVTYELTHSMGEHPELIPQALSICAAWQDPAPFTETLRRHRRTFAAHLTGYQDELNRLARDLSAQGEGVQQSAVNLWLELEAFDLASFRSFDELHAAWLGSQVLKAKQNILLLMGRQAGRGHLSLNKVTGLMRSLVTVEPGGLRDAGGPFPYPEVLEAAREALVTALAQAAPLTDETLQDLLSLTTDRTAERDTQAWLREPLRRLAGSGRAGEAFDLYARIGELTTDRGANHQNKLANALQGALLTVCDSATPAELRWRVSLLPTLPIPFAQILVRVLVRTSLSTVRGPLQDLAFDDRLPGAVAITIKTQLALHGRLRGSVVMDDLLAPPPA